MAAGLLYGRCRVAEKEKRGTLRWFKRYQSRGAALFVSLVSPHPGLLPWGEGEHFPALLKFSRASHQSAGPGFSSTPLGGCLSANSSLSFNSFFKRYISRLRLATSSFCVGSS